jgi:hypothetical protein
MKNNLLALCGALVGGTLGYFAFFWIVAQGFYALALPGGLLGLGAGLVPNRSRSVAIVCGFLAIALGVYTEYHFRPFKADKSLSYFLSHLFDLQPLTLLMIAVGGLIGFWIPFRRQERGQPRLAAGRPPGPKGAKS